MPLPNKGISKAVREEFINGVHEPEAMLVKLAHLNTDANRKAYIIALTKTLREKHGMQTKRNKRHGKKKTGAKNKQMQLDMFKTPMGEGKSAIFRTPVIRKKVYGVDVERLADIAMQDKDLVARFQQLADELPSVSDVMNFRNENDVTAEYGKLRAVEADRDYVTAEYIKKDDELRALQVKYDDMVDSIGELKREIARLQVIITYLEGKK